MSDDPDSGEGHDFEAGGDTREIDSWMYQFTARLAHDMRAPLGAIFMWVHVLRSGDKTDVQSAVDAIEASARRQSRMMGDLVDMARAVVGRLPVDRRPVDLRSLVRSAVEEKVKDASVHRVVLDWDGGAAADSEVVIHADARRLQQALASVILHAVAGTPGGGSVTIRLSPAVMGGGGAEVRIHLPTGGLDAEALADLFIPYRAVGIDLKAAEPEFGMGLVFARNVARLHGGSLDVENDGARGALTFVMRLPLAGPRQDAAG